jgi:hypothetical protein
MMTELIGKYYKIFSEKRTLPKFLRTLVWSWYQEIKNSVDVSLSVHNFCWYIFPPVPGRNIDFYFRHSVQIGCRRGAGRGFSVLEGDAAGA